MKRKEQTHKFLLFIAISALSTSAFAMDTMEGPGCWLTTHVYSTNQYNTYPIATQTLQSTSIKPFIEEGQRTIPLPSIPSHELPDVPEALRIKHELQDQRQRNSSNIACTIAHANYLA